MWMNGTGRIQDQHTISLMDYLVDRSRRFREKSACFLDGAFEKKPIADSRGIINFVELYISPSQIVSFVRIFNAARDAIESRDSKICDYVSPRTMCRVGDIKDDIARIIENPDADGVRY